MKPEPDNAPRAAQITLLGQQGINSSIGSFFSVMAATAIFGMHGISDFLFVWSIIGLLVAGTRALILKRQLGQLGNDPAELSRLEKTHYWSGLLSAAAWGSLAFMPFTHLPIHMQALIWAAPVLVATVAMSSYSIVLRHYRDFLIVLMTCALSGIVSNHGLVDVGGIIMYALLGPVFYVTGRRYHDYMLNAQVAQQKTEKALTELENANRFLTEQQALISQEEDIARHVFHQLTLASENERSGVHTWNQAMGSLSGDLIQIAHTPDDTTYVFLGDFTGHGLPAALGAVPASTVFQAMVNKGLPVSDIARELNRKLNTLLPTGYFCCAVLMRLSSNSKEVEIWNGGLPPIAIRHGRTGDVTQIPAQNLPLGVVDDSSFLEGCTQCRLQEDDSVYIYSDGLTEAENVEGEMWGRERLLAFLQRQDLNSPRLDALKEEILDFTNLAPASDDISIIEIEACQDVAKQQVA